MSIRTSRTVGDQGLEMGYTPAQDSRAQLGAPQPLGASHTTTSSGCEATRGDANRSSEEKDGELGTVESTSIGSEEERRPYSVFTKNEKWFIVVAIAFAGLLG